MKFNQFYGVVSNQKKIMVEFTCIEGKFEDMFEMDDLTCS